MHIHTYLNLQQGDSKSCFRMNDSKQKNIRYITKNRERSVHRPSKGWNAQNREDQIDSTSPLTK